jgi:coronin-1B/1C/6
MFLDVIASCGEDCNVFIWSIPEDGIKENATTPVCSFNTHTRKVGHVLFHPVADNILLSSGADLLLKLYDLKKGQEKQDISGHPDIVNSVAWNYNGSKLATACKDKNIRLLDPRSGKITEV